MTNLLGRLGTQRRRRVRSRAADEMLASERRVRFQAALAECASALLASSGEDQLKRALEALLNATDASYVFIERNVIDPDLGFCSQSVIEAARPTAALEPSDSEYWDLVPWDRMPTSRSYLERGEPFVIIPDELDGVEYQQYAADPWPFKSELNIPIHVHGEWAGLIGITDVTSATQWSDEDLSLLTSAADMISAFWERENRHTDADEITRYKTALAECAQSLLADDRIQPALEALLVATEATYVFLERNIVDSELGFCTQVVAETAQPGADDYELENQYWDLVPWKTMPYSRQILEAGRPAVIIPEELEGPEYDTYAADPYPVKSELELPIFVNGEWAGLIGFSDQTVVRNWTDTDISLLTTAAKMFGARWEREAARERLEQLIRSKDDFLAGVSHELRTPLTAILGLADELAAGTERFAPAELSELSSIIAAESLDMAHLIEDLLVAARVDIGRIHVESSHVDLNRELDEVAAVLQSSVETRCDGEVVALADSSRVRQIIRNLLTNAERYGGPHVVATVRSHHDHVELRVQDDGPGIPADRLDRIFELYERGHERPTQAQSIGVGLTVSRQLAQLMNGDLTYRFDHGCSIFTLTLPAVEPLPATNGQPPTAPTQYSDEGLETRETVAWPHTDEYVHEEIGHNP